MRRTLMAAAVSVALLVAGCGSSSKTPTTPASTSSPASTSGSTTSTPTTTTAMTNTGSAGTMGPPTSGTTYSATNSTVLSHINAALVKFFTSKGFSGVTANCTGVNPSTASCKVTGTNSQGHTSSAVLTISVNQTTGQLKIVHVAS